MSKKPILLQEIIWNLIFMQFTVTETDSGSSDEQIYLLERRHQGLVG